MVMLHMIASPSVVIIGFLISWQVSQKCNCIPLQTCITVLKNLRFSFCLIPDIYPPGIKGIIPQQKHVRFLDCVKPRGGGVAGFTRIRPMLSSVPRGALIPVKPTPLKLLLHVSIGMCGELKGRLQGRRWCKLVGLVAYPSSSSSSSSFSSHMPCFLEGAFGIWPYCHCHHS